MSKQFTDTETILQPAKPTVNKLPWINPVGGLGDMLMFSGVLKQAFDKNPDKKYNLVKRTKYREMLNGHPAIETIGFPKKDDEIVHTSYWNMEELGEGKQRAYQILARSFGLETPVEESLYFPGGIKEDLFLQNFIPWKKKNILISTSSDSPRKMMQPFAWHQVVEKLLSTDALVIQAGKQKDLYIKGCYSVLGATTPTELISLLSKCDLVICADNFVMHAARLVNKPAIVLWGPTSHKVYGYPNHVHFQADTDFCEFKSNCIGPHCSSNYGTACPLKEKHCLNKINIDELCNSVFNLI